MYDESSNEVIAMQSEESQASMPGTSEQNALTSEADRPLMRFFKRLIFNKQSQNTMLTNAQLEDILNKELDFNLTQLHALQVEIYVTILKKYLKEWPMWDEFETTTKDLTENCEHTAFVKVLEKGYNSLKNYLKENLLMAKELSADLVAKVRKSEQKKMKRLPVEEERKSTDTADVILEITATRDQLNKLIYRQPHSAFNNTIFNGHDAASPSSIRLNTLSLEAILNWWSVKITISLQMNNIFLTRETTHELDHLLINRQGRSKETSPSIVTLNEKIQIKESKKMQRVTTTQVLAILKLLSSKHSAQMEGQEVIFNYLKKDIERMQVVAAPAQYRRYLSTYPYVRYLYSEPEIIKTTDKTVYDIQLKETISPMHQYSIGRLDVALDKTLPPQWLKVECLSCNVTCSGEKLATELRQHFDECHQPEPDWQCTNCQKNFPMALLAENWWSHKCEEMSVVLCGNCS